MVKLVDVWYDQDRTLDLAQFAEKLGVSRSTIGKIMTAERKDQQHPVSPHMAKHLARKLCEILGCNLTIKDLEGVTLAQPRPGRPKGKKEGDNA